MNTDVAFDVNFRICHFILTKSPICLWIGSLRCHGFHKQEAWWWQRLLCGRGCGKALGHVAQEMLPALHDKMGESSQGGMNIHAGIGLGKPVPIL